MRAIQYSLHTSTLERCLNGLLDAEQDAVGTEDVARLAKELDLVEVGRQVVGALVLLPRGAAVLGAEDGAAAADGPADLGVGQEDHVEDACGAKRLAHSETANLAGLAGRIAGLDPPPPSSTLWPRLNARQRAVAARLDLELLEGDVDQLGVELGGTLGDLA